MEKEQKQVESKKRGVIIAFSILLAFFLVSKLLSSITTNPAQISYEKRCASCHGMDGKGTLGLIPPLADADWLRKNQNILACVIKNGIKGKITVNQTEYDIDMLPQVNIQDIEITNLINYVNTSWGNNIKTVKNSEVVESLKSCN